MNGGALSSLYQLNFLHFNEQTDKESDKWEFSNEGFSGNLTRLIKSCSLTIWPRGFFDQIYNSQEGKRIKGNENYYVKIVKIPTNAMMPTKTVALLTAVFAAQ